MVLNIPEEKQIIIDAVKARRNICVTGAAGTGKSFLLQLIKSHFPYVHITASTGVAAVNVGGMTIHSWAGIGKATLSAEEIAKFIHSGPGTKIRRQIKKAKLLAIDEISMISSSVFNLLNNVFKLVRQKDLPFGGIQLVVLGDFFQLPPIAKEEQVEFCFNSQAWLEAEFQVFELTEIFRQSDLRFIKLLHNIRHGTLNDEDHKLLKTRECAIPQNLKPTILVTHNVQAERLNSKMLADIQEETVTFEMTSSGGEHSVDFLKRNCLAPEILTLKIGAQVMMLKNNLYKQGIINGSIGSVTGFTPNNIPIVKFHNGTILPVAAEEWNIETFNEDKGKIEVLASIKQIPLVLAWAITIHKSQGMTLDNIFCDLSNVFAEGQAYVALSRVKSLEGLFLKGFKPHLLKINHKVKVFYDKEVYSNNILIL